MGHNLYLIIRREYLERVRRKSFIITTLIMPVLMLALMAAPSLAMLLSTPESKTIAVIDDSGFIAPELNDMGELAFVPVPLSLDSAKNDENFDAVLVIGKDVIDNPADIRLYSRESSSLQTEGALSGMLENIIRDRRLQKYDIPGLDKILADSEVDVTMQTFRIGEEDGADSALVSYILGMVLMMTLYMFIILYGQMVMTSIIEEKNNRVLEVVVSSVKPTTLLAGKILGVGAVAVTQVVIWGAIVLLFSALGMPALLGQVNSAGADPSAVAALSMLADPLYIAKIFGLLIFFLLGGYLFYSSIYAAIGSAVDNIQDASQLQSVAIVPVILSLILSFNVIADPSSTLAMWLSYIPFTSPMIMMVRMPFGIPVYQTIISAVILLLSVWGMIWLSAKIYRVGIFMYGKKPNLRDLARWARYK